MKIHTTTLTSGSLVLQKDDGAMVISIKANAGSSCLITGGIAFKGEPSTPTPIGSFDVFNYAAPPASPIDDLTITWVSGTVDIVVGF